MKLDRVQQRVLRAVTAGEDWKDVAVKNDVKLRSAYHWIAAAQYHDDWESSPRKPRGGKRNAKITEEYVHYLLSLLDENCYLPLDELVDALEARLVMVASSYSIEETWWRAACFLEG